ncbi:MAG: hypothetical protein QW104_05165 [Nitrososphaerota archaeon]
MRGAYVADQGGLHRQPNGEETLRGGNGYDAVKKIMRRRRFVAYHRTASCICPYERRCRREGANTAWFAAKMPRGLGADGACRQRVHSGMDRREIRHSGRSSTQGADLRCVREGSARLVMGCR